MLTFGGQLRLLRERKGCTREELARASKVSLGAIRDYEQGRREPSLKNAARLAKALDGDLAALAAVLDLRGVKVLPQGQSKYSRLTFGMYKGRHLNHVPADYLEWLLKERPRLLRPGQIEQIETLLQMADPTKTFDPRSGSAKDTDPVIERARRERSEKKPKKLDPEYFG